MCVWPSQFESDRPGRKLLFVKMCCLWRGTAAPALIPKNKGFARSRDEADGRQMISSSPPPVLPFLLSTFASFLRSDSEEEAWRISLKFSLLPDFHF